MADLARQRILVARIQEMMRRYDSLNEEARYEVLRFLSSGGAMRTMPLKKVFKKRPRESGDHLYLMI